MCSNGFERIHVLDWVLEVDREATLAAYRRLPRLGCECIYCRNYLAACQQLPAGLKDLCSRLGIDLAKDAEVYEICGAGNGRHRYGAFYHAVGRIVEGRDVGVPVREHGGRIELARLDEDVEIGFTTGASLVPEGFPRPVLQAEFVSTLPWVLPEPVSATGPGL